MTDKHPGGLRPFDLAAAKDGAKLITRDGRNARFIAHVGEASPGYSLLAYIDGEPCAYAYWADGTINGPREDSHATDLFIVGETRRLTVTLWRSNVDRRIVCVELTDPVQWGDLPPIVHPDHTLIHTCHVDIEA